MKKHLTILLLLLSICPATTVAQNEKFIVSLNGGIYLNNEQAWLLEPSFSWLFHKFIGIGTGLEFTSQYNQPCRTAIIDGHEAELTDNERNVAWVIVKPYLLLRSPALWKTSDNYMRLWIQAEPGISFACPFRNSLTYRIKEIQGNVSHTADYKRFPNKDLQWFYWNARISVKIAIDRLIIGAGYSLSNLDYYSCRRNVTLSDGHNFYVPKKELSQSIHLSLGYSF